MSTMNWGICRPQVRFDPRSEREEFEKLYAHPARVLQHRMVRRGHTDRTRRPEIPEWKKVYQMQAHEGKVLHQARVLGWGREKRCYFANIRKAGPLLRSG